jgi:hypothetical protein
MAVSTSRKYYIDQTSQKNIPFICVSHNIWDSKCNDILGEIIHFKLPYSLDTGKHANWAKVYEK